MEEYRKTILNHKKRIGDDTVIVIESDVGFKFTRHRAGIEPCTYFMFITGGIDVSQLMAFGSPDEVREACRKAIDDTGGVGYFIGSTTELHPAVKMENVLAMVETAHAFSAGNRMKRSKNDE